MKYSTLLYVFFFNQVFVNGSDAPRFYKITPNEAREASNKGVDSGDDSGVDWDDYQLACQANGDNLASIHSESDQQKACDACDTGVCYLGGYQCDHSTEGPDGYCNIDETPMDWVPSNRDGWSSTGENVLAIYSSTCSIHDWGNIGDDWSNSDRSAICYSTGGGGGFGDPHIKAWNGEQFDFHGVCDLVMAHNPEFGNGSGLDVHIRSKKMNQWSYIDSAVVRIGEDTLEVRGGKMNEFWINSIRGDDNTDKLKISEYPIEYHRISKNSKMFVVDIGNGEGIVIKTWNSFVSIMIENAKHKNFGGSVGLMGSFPEGLKIGRDNSIIEDTNAFGQEWQVLFTEQNLFHNIEGPQHPQQCDIPSNIEMRRHLSESLVTVGQAEKACIGADSENMDLCVFDVLATNDQSSAGAY